MSLAAAKLEAPRPAEIDERAELFHQLELDLQTTKAELDALRAKQNAEEVALIELVRECGGPHALKSKILHGIAWEMVATFSQYTTTDTAGIERFRQALIAAKQIRLLKKIFTSEVRWTLKASAGDIVRAEKLSPRLMALLLQCQVTQDRKPSLDVRPKKKPAGAA